MGVNRLDHIAGGDVNERWARIQHRKTAQLHSLLAHERQPALHFQPAKYPRADYRPQPLLQ
jgi:hypothetical protein